MTPDEKLVIEGGRVKVVTQARQTEATRAGQSGVIVDYLRFTIKRDELVKFRNIPLDTDDQNLANVYAFEFAKLLGYQLGVNRPGRDYYEFTTTIDNANGHEVASVSAGGEGQRGTVCFTLKGEGCTFARETWERRVFEFFDGMSPKITRIDCAKDFFSGELTFDECAHAYQFGEFDYRNRRPSTTQFGSVVQFDGVECNSRTFQVGKRDSGKLFRGYEKDHQFKNMDGKWFRAEVELRSVNRIIPWDALVNAGAIFAGAYDFTAMLAEKVQALKVPTATKVAEAGAAACIRWVNRVVAPTMVILASVTEDLDWFADIAFANKERRVPRSLRGLSLPEMKAGFLTGLSKFKSSIVPADEAHSLMPA